MSKIKHALTCVYASPNKTFECPSSLHRLNDWLPWNFQRLIQVVVSIKCLSQKVDIVHLRSGQCCALSIIPKSIGENWKAPLLEEYHSKHSQTSGYRKAFATIDPYSCPRGHRRSWKIPIVFRQKLLIDMLERLKHLRYVQVDDTLTLGLIFKMIL